MRPITRYMSTVLAILLTAPQGVFAAAHHVAAESHLALSEQALAAVWGGIFGGKIGQRNEGILEMNCAPADDYPASSPPAWESTEIAFFDNCPNGRPHFFPHYQLPGTNPRIAVNAFITREKPTPGSTSVNPRVNIYKNGVFVAFVTCSNNVAGYKGGFATGPTVGDLELEAWACPVYDAYATVDLGASNYLTDGLINSVRAVTDPGFLSGPGGFETPYQDQEVRFFRVN